MKALEHDKGLEQRVEADARHFGGILEKNIKIIEDPAAKKELIQAATPAVVAEVKYEKEHIHDQTKALKDGTAYAARDMVYYRYV